MIEKITLTEDVLKLIPHFCFTEALTEDEISDLKYPKLGLDYNSLYGGSFLLEDLSLIFGTYNEAIPETVDTYSGPRFPQEIEDRMLAAHTFVIEHLKEIEEIVHQFSVKGGISEGTYECDHRVRIWERK